MKRAVVISASSDIGGALCKDWIERGWEVLGTYRSVPPPFLSSSIHCDLSDSFSIEKAIVTLQKKMPEWDVLAFANGTMNPIGDFEKVPFSDWEQGVSVNLLKPLQILHSLLPYRHPQATVLFFAGAGSNGSAPSYSAYALSKIALIKICELLDAEIPDVRFVIVGPGWVKTKIHQETLEAQAGAGKNYQITLEHLNKNEEFTPMKEVIRCCNWLIHSSLKEVGGRNYSVVYDHCGEEELEKLLKENPDMYKLRRHGNGSFVKTRYGDCR